LSPPTVTLLSDFGLQDGHAAAMKAVILTVCPDARLVDISHIIPPQNIRSGAYVFYSCYRYFPKGTIHLAVVDPEVGTQRGAIAIRARACCFVGPDNGIFSLALREESEWEARRLENERLRPGPLSRTFHGRDLFAPAAAHLACGFPFEEIGPLCEPVFPNWHEQWVGKGEVRGEVMHSDRFGNVITNVPGKVLEEQGPAGNWALKAGNRVIESIGETYAQVRAGEMLALTGSTGLIEIAVNRGSAASELKLESGTEVVFKLSNS